MVMPLPPVRSWAALEIPEHAGPPLRALAIAVLDGEQFLDAILPDADHDQQAHLRILTEADLDVDPIHEQVRVPAEAQQPLTKPVVMGLPLLAQPADRRRRQPGGVLAEQAFQRRAEVPSRQALEVQDRDHLPDLRRPSGVRRQDPRAELLPLTLLVDALVVDSGRPDRDRARPDGHPALPGPLAFAAGPPAGDRPRPDGPPPLPRTAVADHLLVPVPVELVAEPLDVLVGLSPERGGDHPPRALPRQLIQRERDLLVALPSRERANIRHGVPSFPAFRRSVFNQPGRYAAFPLNAVHNIRL